MNPKNLREGIELIVYNYNKEDWEILFNYLKTLGKRTNPKFNETIFNKYIDKTVKQQNS